MTPKQIKAARDALVKFEEEYNEHDLLDLQLMGVIPCIQKALDLSLAVLEDDKWLPIESAPKDGTRILLCCMDVSKLTVVKNGFMAVNKWVGYWGSFNPRYFPATHWQPLPPAPKSNVSKVLEKDNG